VGVGVGVGVKLLTSSATVSLAHSHPPSQNISNMLVFEPLVCVMGDTGICHKHVAYVLGGRVGVSETHCGARCEELDSYSYSYSHSYFHSHSHSHSYFYFYSYSYRYHFYFFSSHAFISKDSAAAIQQQQENTRTMRIHHKSIKHPSKNQRNP
jgi:hypothetical protein